MEWVSCAFSYSVSNEESGGGLATATNVSIVRSFMILSVPKLEAHVCLTHMYAKASVFRFENTQCD